MTAGQDSEDLQFERQRRLAWVLALCGLIPFALAAVGLVVLGAGNPLAGPLTDAFTTYGAVILSFLGGIRWGAAIRHGNPEEETAPDNMALVASVVPALAGWAALFLTGTASIALLLLAFCAQGAWDSLSASSDRLPAWMSSLRITLTLSVAACHIAVLLAIL